MLSNLLEDFCTYTGNNRNLIPNYGIKYYYGDVISTAFVESTVNEVISKRMVKKADEMDKKRCSFIVTVKDKEFKWRVKKSF